MPASANTTLPQLIVYDTACKAIAEAASVDEIKAIRDASIAMKAYARQAKNRDLEANAIEIRMRATRRLDQMRQAQKATIGLATGTRGNAYGRVMKKPAHDVPTLAEAGIDKNLANEGRKLGSLTEPQFEKAIADIRDSVAPVLRVRLPAKAKTKVKKSKNTAAARERFQKEVAEANRKAEIKIGTARMQTLMFQAVCRLFADMKPSTRMRVRRHLEENYGNDT